MHSRFIDFEGDLDCRISSTDLYLPPSSDPLIMKKKLPFCKDRQSLLEALNGGGRHGFDEPFVPRGNADVAPLARRAAHGSGQVVISSGTRQRRFA